MSALTHHNILMEAIDFRTFAKQLDIGFNFVLTPKENFECSFIRILYLCHVFP